MDTKKRKRYEAIVQQVIELAGGKRIFSELHIVQPD